MTNWTYANKDESVVTGIGDDGMVLSRSILDKDVQEWIAEGNVPSPFVAPVDIPQEISKRQLLIEMASAGYITGTEALAAAQTGAVPAAFATIINALPVEQQLPAQITWASMTVVPITDPLVQAFATTHGLTQDQVNAFFVAASQY